MRKTHLIVSASVAWVSFVASVASAATIAVTTAADSGPGSLRDAVGKAPAGSVITFNLTTNDAAYHEASRTWSITLTSGQIKFRKALTIHGDGTVAISGRDKNRIFTSESTDTLTLIGLTLLNGRAAGSGDYGAGGAVWSRGSVTATRCVFIGNAADKTAGAVWASQSVIADGCEFSSNTADLSGGAVCADKGSATLTGCVFSGNTADKGTAVSAHGTATLTGCTFSGNAPRRRGITSGAVRADTVTAADCTFSGNTAHTGTAVDAATVTLSDCAFTDNAATGSGGAVSASAAFTATGCTFADNKADASGGAVSVGDKSAFTASGCTFTGNIARDSGGAVNAGHSAAATGCAFFDNAAGKGGAVSATIATARNCAFAGNTADSDGGAVCASRTATVTGSIFTDNEARRNGGAVYASGAAAVANSSIVGNRTGREYSGAIDTAGAAYLYHATVADNDGSGVYIRDAQTAPTLYAYNSIIVGNSAKIQAGFGYLNKITAFSSGDITGASLIERVTGGASREAVFGANEADADGIIDPRGGGPADRAARALTAVGIAVPSGVNAKDVTDALRSDISGARRPASGKVSHGARE